jgi:hypothetical protein
MKKIINFFQNINWSNVFNSYHNRILGLRADFVVDPRYKPYTNTLAFLAVFGIMFIQGRYVTLGWFADSKIGNCFAYGLAILTWIGLCQLLPRMWQASAWVYKQIPHIKKLILKSAGVNTKVLDALPEEAKQSETTKYLKIGLAVFVDPLLAVVTGTYIGCEIFKLPCPYLLGLFWGMVILIIEMVMIITMKRNANGGFGWKTLALRLVLAIALGVVVTTPLELRIFESEIKEQLALELMENDKKFDEEKEVEKAAIDEKIAAEQARVDAFKADYDAEINTSIAGRPGGYGREAKKKEQLWYEQDTAFQNRILPDLKKEKEGVDKKWATKKNQWKEAQASGLGARLEALHRTAERKPIVFKASIGVALLFIFLGIIAVLAKLMTTKGPYEEAIEAIEIAAANASQSNRDAKLAQQHTILEQVKLVEGGKLQVANIEQQTVVAIATETAALHRETARLEVEHRAQTQRAINFEVNRLDGTTITAVASAMHTSAQIQRIAGELAQVIAQITSLTAEQIPYLKVGLEQHRDKLRLELEALTA